MAENDSLSPDRLNNREPILHLSTQAFFGGQGTRRLGFLLSVGCALYGSGRTFLATLTSRGLCGEVPYYCYLLYGDLAEKACTLVRGLGRGGSFVQQDQTPPATLHRERSLKPPPLHGLESGICLQASWALQGGGF